MEFTKLLPLLIFIGIGYIIFQAFRGTFGGRGKVSDDGKYICPHCGTRGTPRTQTRGSILIEIVLWLCFIIPGLIYSLWRITTRQPVCPGCGERGMIPVSTPAGKRLIDGNK